MGSDAKAISAAVGPLDFLEEIWVNDIVYFCWEIRRLRRLKGTCSRPPRMTAWSGCWARCQGSKSHAEHMAKG